MTMGTSVPYIKPSKRFLWPTACKKIDDEFSLFLGGSCVCGIFHGASQSVLINTNSGSAADQLQKFVESEIKERPLAIFNTSLTHDFFAGNKNYSRFVKYYIPSVGENSLRELWPDKPEQVESLEEERRFEFEGETFVVVPVKDCASHIDLVIFLEKRKILFLGALFYNHIHPVLKPLDGMNVSNWIRNLDSLMSRFQALQIIPAEGDIGDSAAMNEFISYLKALSDPGVEFSECRKTYDWIEIPGQTSLEENFDLLRENIKSFTKF